MTCKLKQPHPGHCKNAIKDIGGSRAALGCEYPNCPHGITLDSLPAIPASKPKKKRARKWPDWVYICRKCDEKAKCMTTFKPSKEFPLNGELECPVSHFIDRKPCKINKPTCYLGKI